MVVLEFNDYWRSALRPLESRFPHRLQVPQLGNFGIAPYSRVPVESVSCFPLVQEGFPAIEAKLGGRFRNWTVLGVHVSPPVSAVASNLRNVQFAELANRVHSQGGPLVMVGDLNCTRWSPYFSQLLRASGLADSQVGGGYQPTWPQQLPALKIPIDHCLTTSDLRVTRRWLTDPIGSDHLGLCVEMIAN